MWRGSTTPQRPPVERSRVLCPLAAPLLRGLQPQARMIVTLAEPVRRMYSDYYFLTSNSVAFDAEGKSPEDFDAIATAQMAEMRRCFRERAVSEGGAEVQDHELLTNLPIRAEQSCAYDRYHFGRPGSGRICIGLYHAFLRRWLEVSCRTHPLFTPFHSIPLNFVAQHSSFSSKPTLAYSVSPHFVPRCFP